MHPDPKSSLGSVRLPSFSAMFEPWDIIRMQGLGIKEPPMMPACRALASELDGYTDRDMLMRALRNTAEKLAASRKENGVLRERNAALEAADNEGCAATLQASVMLNYALTMALLSVGVIWMGR